MTKPTQPADYRPISLTPILSRIFERFLVRKCLYPSLLAEPNIKLLSNQFAFKPTGSTTAALINLFHTVTTMLSEYPYIHIISLDFSKAFDTLRHSEVLNSFSNLGLPDEPYNWLCAFLENRKHITRFNSQFSSQASINASVIQGSASGPVCFITNMASLKRLNSLNELSEYADDCYLIVPSTNSNSIPAELQHIKSWAGNCNLKLNSNKCKEIILTRKNVNRVSLPKPLEDLERVTSLCVLGVTFNQAFSFSEHVNNLISKGHQRLFALKILKNHGLPIQQLYNTANSLFTSIFTYASPAWSGFLLVPERHKIEAIFKKAVKWGVLNPNHAPIEQIFEGADTKLFQSILANPGHCLHHLLPPLKMCPFTLRPRAHNRTLPSYATTLQRNSFIYRQLYKNSY